MIVADRHVAELIIKRVRKACEATLILDQECIQGKLKSSSLLEYNRSQVCEAFVREEVLLYLVRMC